MKLDISWRLVCAAIAAATLASACASESPPPVRYSLNGQGALTRIYRLGIGDKLKVTVFGEENLSGTVEVNAVGQVPLPWPARFLRAA